MAYSKISGLLSCLMPRLRSTRLVPGLELAQTSGNLGQAYLLASCLFSSPRQDSQSRG